MIFKRADADSTAAEVPPEEVTSFDGIEMSVDATTFSRNAYPTGCCIDINRTSSLDTSWGGLGFHAEKKIIQTRPNCVTENSTETDGGVFIDAVTKTDSIYDGNQIIKYVQKQNILKEASMRGLSTLSGGVTTILIELCEKKNISVADGAKVGINTTKSFVVGHLAAVAHMTKSIEIAGPLLAMTISLSTLLSIGISLADKKDKRTKAEIFMDGLEGAADLIPSGIQIIIAAKNISHVNVLCTLASVAIDATIASYNVYKQVTSENEEERITKTEAAVQIGLAIVYSTATVAVSTIVGMEQKFTDKMTKKRLNRVGCR